MASTPAPSTTPERASDDDRSTGALAGDLRDLVVAYAKQETVDPLKSLGRFVLWGLAGAVFLSLGTILLALAAVRAAQGETGSHLTGNLSWLPYLAGIILAGLVIALAAARIVRSPK